VTNTGDVTLTNVTVSDPLASGCNRTFASLAPGASQTYTCTAVVTAEFTNVATATGTPPVGPNVSASDSAFVDVLPSITVSKTPNPTSVLFTGGSVSYTITVQNTSVEPVTLNSLVDNKFGNLNGQGTCSFPQTIAAGGSYSCTFTATISGAPGSSHVNTVTGAASDNEGNVANGAGSATVTFFWRGRTPGYWKNHPTEWPTFSIVNYNGVSVAIAPTTKVRDVFKVPASKSFSCIKSGDTLLTALDYQGGNTVCGAAEILLRAATAALLNEQFFGTAYPPYNSTSELIAAVNTALASGNRATMINLATTLDNWNNGVH
jgi:hypothetical protein